MCSQQDTSVRIADHMDGLAQSVVSQTQHESGTPLLRLATDPHQPRRWDQGRDFRAALASDYFRFPDGLAALPAGTRAATSALSW